LIFEIRGGALSGNARFLENHQDFLCPDDASNYLKAQKKRWDDMEKVLVDERQKLAPDEFLTVVMIHVRRFFPDEYSEWRKHGTRDDGRRYTFETTKGFVKGMEARGELHPPDKDSKSSRERLAVHSTRMSSTKYGEIADGESFDPVGNLSPMRTDVARGYLHGGSQEEQSRSIEVNDVDRSGSNKNPVFCDWASSSSAWPVDSMAQSNAPGPIARPRARMRTRPEVDFSSESQWDS
jgi:hypothetical protein